MIYYGIVQKIKDKYKSGIYGNRKLEQTELQKFYEKHIQRNSSLILSFTVSNRIEPIISKLVLKTSSEIKLQHSIESDKKQIISVHP